LFSWYLYRGGAEQKIKKIFVSNNFVETIISVTEFVLWLLQLPLQLLVHFQTQKLKNKTQFIVDASGKISLK
jgi:type I restriction-modification system DNA methylase subunit